MRIRWTDLATRDLTEICDYIEEHNSSSIAHRIAVTIHDRVSALVEFPERGRPGQKTGTRELVLSGLPYLVVYRLRIDAVEILRILHGARDWAK